MRVIIDTNIFIYLENDHVVPKNLQRLVLALGDSGVKVLVHPKSIEELKRDHNVGRREVILSKIGNYPVLEMAPDPASDDDFRTRLGQPSGPNDAVDCAMLYALHRNAVAYLLTEDKNLRKKSERVGLRERALSIDEALEIFMPPIAQSSLRHPPSLTMIPAHSLDVSDPFFEPLKADYPSFLEWFKKISQEGRHCLAYFRESGLLGALMIPKLEEEAIDSRPPLTRKKRLKIALLRVESTGYKIGELFVKLAVHDAIAADCEEVYLTHFVKPNDSLVELISEYGFEHVSDFASGEQIFVKEVRPDVWKLASLHPVQISQKYYPTFRDSHLVKKYLVPIRPSYHEKLFVDYSARQTTLPEYRSQFIVEGNTIKKAYLCNSNNRTIHKGDIMLFYRSEDLQEVTSVGVIESIHVNLRNSEDVAKLVRKRTVYSISEINHMLEKPTIVFLFTWHFYLPHPVALLQLQQMGISPPQSLTHISHQKYLEIKRRGGIDERFTVN
jgi:rRNA-processing protein FCF1